MCIPMTSLFLPAKTARHSKPTPNTRRSLIILIGVVRRQAAGSPDHVSTAQGHLRIYAEKRFGRGDGRQADEMALNPQHFAGRPIEETLATLGHEIVHLWQHHFGTSGRGGYHNAEWASVMESIGLIPSHTGKEGGKRTGDRVTQYIEPGGRFAVAVEKLLATGFTITWRELPGNQLSDGKFGRSGSLSGLRFKFSCPDCGDAAWGKSDLYLVCGKHAKRMLPGDGKPAPVTQNPDRNINSTSSSRVDDSVLGNGRWPRGWRGFVLGLRLATRARCLCPRIQH